MPDYRKLVIKITKKQQIQEEKLMDYKNSGVDIEAGYKSVELMKKYVQGTMRPEVLTGLGGFSGAFSMEKFKNMEKPTLVSGTDGVGTKLKLAFLMDKHDTIGIDCVAMCVNDIACAGGEPLFFLDYIACGKNYPEKIAAIVSGVAEGCKQSDAALIGGETAEHPGLMPEDEYDLAGFAVGVVDEKDIITGADVKTGDVLIGMASSGVHSNGFSLVRKIFEMTKESLDTYYDELGKTLGEALLAPTRIYVKALRSIKEAGVRIKACSHITGGGFYENVPRMLPEGKQAVIRKDSYEVPSIFKLMAKKGQVEEKMMYNTYNMGLGMVLAVDPADVDKTMEAIKAAGETPYVVGEIKDGEKGVTLC
jgi:phosphoribosylformylglycinamidine cyclo-ligase